MTSRNNEKKIEKYISIVNISVTKERHRDFDTALNELVKIGDDLVVDKLLALLEEPLEKEYDKVIIAGALVNVGNERVHHPLFNLFKNQGEDSPIRNDLAIILAVAFKDMRVYDALIQFITIPVYLTQKNDRAHTLEALLALEDVRAIPYIIKSLKDPFQWVRNTAVYALGKFKDFEAVEPLIETLTQDEDLRVRAHTAWALGEIGDTDAIFPLLNTLKEFSGANLAKYPKNLQGVQYLHEEIIQALKVLGVTTPEDYLG